MVTVQKAKKIKGEIIIPPDKSISHRSAMFALLTGGVMEVHNYSAGADCRSSLDMIQRLGAKVEFKTGNDIIIDSSEAFKYVDGAISLDCGNSGTSMRLFSGLLAPKIGKFELFGDKSLSKRPMKRIIEPLQSMGAIIEHTDYKAPLKITGNELSAINYTSKIASAQVKSCILLAGLGTDGITSVEEPYISRDHTERMLKYLGADISCEGTRTSVSKSYLEPKNITVCGDISSAAFFLAAGAILPDSEITIKNTGLNPTRTGILEVMEKMGADFEILDKRVECGEEVGDIRVKTSPLSGTTIEGAIIPRLIDEIPIIAVMATQAQGTTVIKDAADLRNKEADRITCLVGELRKLGAKIEETPDGMVIHGGKNLSGGAQVECFHDHRLAMSLYVAGMVCETPVKINEFQWVDISFPEFLPLMGEVASF